MQARHLQCSLLLDGLGGCTMIGLCLGRGGDPYASELGLLERADHRPASRLGLPPFRWQPGCIEFPSQHRISDAKSVRSDASPASSGVCEASYTQAASWRCASR